MFSSSCHGHGNSYIIKYLRRLGVSTKAVSIFGVKYDLTITVIKSQVAIEVCPVNCIHYVEREDLPILEYLIRPQQKSSNGVYGGGWERPRNVFMAARTFKRQVEDKKMGAAGIVRPLIRMVSSLEMSIKMAMSLSFKFWEVIQTCLVS